MYFNTLIIMNEDALGYGNRSRKPSGYCKLTMPNRVSCYVQGLRQLPKGQMYRLYLTSKSKQQSVEVGMLQVGSSGNKETRWVMDPVSINNSHVNAQEIDGAFIMVSGDSIKGQVIPLVGFSSEPYIWEHLVEKHEEPVPQEKAKPAKVAIEVKEQLSQLAEVEKVDVAVETEAPVVNQVMETEQLDPPTEVILTREADLPAEPTPVREVAEADKADTQIMSDQVTSLKDEVEKLNRTIQESKAIIEALQNQTRDTVDMEEEATRTPPIPTQGEVPVPETLAQPVLPAPVMPEPASTYPEPLDKASNINDYINNFLRKFQEAEPEKPRTNYADVGEIYKKRIPINPFEAQDTGIKWVRITHDDLRSLPSLDSQWVNQPFVIDAHRDYKHFILGKDQAGIGYYIGVPGVFDPKEQSPLEIDKIEKFSCCHNVPPRNGEAGYWIGTI